MTTVYFLPGMMCDKQLWQATWEHLPQSWNLHYLPMEQCDTRPDMVAMLDAALAAKRGHMVGFSMGGYLALEYGLNNPQAYHSLTMVGASAFGLSAAERDRRLKYLPMLKQGGYKGISRHRMAQFVHPDKLDDPAVGGVVREMDVRLGKETLIRQITSGSLRESFLEQLSDLRCPTQLVGAELDGLIKPASLRKMEERIPDVRLEMLADTGHMIPLERPRELAALLEKFIAGHA